MYITEMYTSPLGRIPVTQNKQVQVFLTEQKLLAIKD